MVTSKLLSVRRFLRLYQDIMHQLSAVTSAAAGEHPDLGGEFCASMIIDGYVISNQMLQYEVWFVTTL